MKIFKTTPIQKQEQSLDIYARDVYFLKNSNLLDNIDDLIVVFHNIDTSEGFMQFYYYWYTYWLYPIEVTFNNQIPTSIPPNTALIIYTSSNISKEDTIRLLPKQHEFVIDKINTTGWLVKN